MAGHDLPYPVKLETALLAVAWAGLNLGPGLPHILADADRGAINEMRCACEDPAGPIVFMPVGARTLTVQAIDLPAVEVRPRHLPVLPLGVRMEEERSLYSTHQYSHLVGLTRHCHYPPIQKICSAL